MDNVFIAFHGLGILYMIYLGTTMRVQNVGQAMFFKLLPLMVSFAMSNELLYDLSKYFPRVMSQ